jgi:hypothetical protein
MRCIVGGSMALIITSDADEEWFRSPAIDRAEINPNVARAWR